MTISKKEFEIRWSFPDEKTEVIDLLKNRRDEAFLVREIRDSLHIPERRVNSILVNLLRKNMVKHKQPYWIWFFDEAGSFKKKRKKVK